MHMRWGPEALVLLAGESCMIVRVLDRTRDRSVRRMPSHGGRPCEAKEKMVLGYCWLSEQTDCNVGAVQTCKNVREDKEEIEPCNVQKCKHDNCIATAPA